MSLAAIARYFAKPAAPLLVFLLLGSVSRAQAVTSPDVIIELRLAGKGAPLPRLRECLTSKLLQMPDVEIASPPAHGVRFVIDILTARGPDNAIFASFVLTQTFPLAEFRPRFKKGNDAGALLTAIRYYTLLRLHEIVPGRSAHIVCAKIASEIANKVLSIEYTERDD